MSEPNEKQILKQAKKLMRCKTCAYLSLAEDIYEPKRKCFQCDYTNFPWPIEIGWFYRAETSQFGCIYWEKKNDGR